MRITSYEFLEKWIMENKNSILGNEVFKAYEDYVSQALKQGYRAFRTSMFIETVTDILECRKVDFFM